MPLRMTAFGHWFTRVNKRKLTNDHTTPTRSLPITPLAARAAGLCHCARAVRRGSPAQRSRRFAVDMQAAGQVFVPLLVVPPPSKGYYVDCTGGNDANSGTAESAAWKSLAKARTAPLAPGDRLLFKRGCTWTGPLYLDWNGGSGRPIVIDAYGSGYLPIVQNAQYDVIIRGTNLLIQNLAARGTPQSYDPGCQNQPKGWQHGFRLSRALRITPCATPRPLA